MDLWGPELTQEAPLLRTHCLTLLCQPPQAAPAVTQQTGPTHPGAVFMTLVGIWSLTLRDL